MLGSNRSERQQLCPPAWTVWFTGLSGSGKSTLSNALASYLDVLSIEHEIIDGDQIRQDLCRGLGFSREDRYENVRRIGYIAALLNRHHVVSIIAAISPYREARDRVRQQIARFLEVHIDCPLESLVKRDAKGLYKRALAGRLENFTGVSAPYEPPLAPELYLNSEKQSESECLALIVGKLRELDWISVAWAAQPNFAPEAEQRKKAFHDSRQMAATIRPGFSGSRRYE